MLQQLYNARGAHSDDQNSCLVSRPSVLGASGCNLAREKGILQIPDKMICRNEYDIKFQGLATFGERLVASEHAQAPEGEAGCHGHAAATTVSLTPVFCLADRVSSSYTKLAARDLHEAEVRHVFKAVAYRVGNQSTTSTVLINMLTSIHVNINPRDLLLRNQSIHGWGSWIEMWIDVDASQGYGYPDICR
jgi:hypothetical protein